MDDAPIATEVLAPADDMSAPMAAADPLSAPPPSTQNTEGGSQRVPLGALASNAPAPLMAPQAMTAPPRALPPAPSITIEEATARSVAAQQAVAEREFTPQPAVINAPMLGGSPASAPPADNAMREFVPASLTGARPARDPVPGVMLSAADRNTIQRFDALNRLRDAELITGEEFAKRRMANIGSLLPYSKPLPGQGLDRPVPSPDAIIARLAALGRSLEMRAITPRQHQLERNMILNALLPEAPEAKAMRRQPPSDFLEAAGMVGKLELLRAQSLISDDEFDSESEAIEKFMNTGQFPSDKAMAQPRKAAQPAMAAKPDPVEAKAPMPPAISGPLIHLASLRTEDAAMKAWGEAQSKTGTALSALTPVVRKIDLGQQQGIFYRLMAGPFPDIAAAEATCIQIKQSGQFCRPTDGNS